VFLRGGKRKTGGKATANSRWKTSAIAESEAKISLKSGFSSLNLANFHHFGQFNFKGEKMFSAHGWVGQGKL